MQPQKIGRYRVTGRLGQGAMGVVYSARDDQMGRDVAVKMMTNQLESDPAARARFFREAQLTSKLLHRNVVTVLDLGEEDGHPFLVMELLKGSTLSKALREPRLAGIEPKMDLMVQTCDGLARAHAAGVVHRDIKPSNLFVLPDGSLKILDFGVARLADSSMTKAGLVIGTPDYMSPEQARGDEVDARSDVFSAAAVFYFMLTGRRPFEAPDLPSVLRKVINEDVPPVPSHEAPATLTRAILRGLRKNPGSRYQSCADMAAELARVRRHFDGETRQLASTIQAQFERTLHLAGGVASLRVKTGAIMITPPVDHADGLRQRFPFLIGRTIDSGPLPMVFRRDRLNAIADDLRAVREALISELEALAVDAAGPLHPVVDRDERRAVAVPGSGRSADDWSGPGANRSGSVGVDRTLIDPVNVRGAGDDRWQRDVEPSAEAKGFSGLIRRTAGSFNRWLPGGKRGRTQS